MEFSPHGFISGDIIPKGTDYGNTPEGAGPSIGQGYPLIPKRVAE
jgi:hypothetical protein